MITPQQREKRKQYIGSSDIGSILGLNPYQTAYEVWASKVFDNQEQKTTEAIDCGNALEAGIIAWLSEVYGIEFDTEPLKMQFTMSENPLVLSHVDGLSEKRGIIAEGKYTSVGAEWGVQSEEIPNRVYTQCQWQLAATGFESILVGVVVDPFRHIQNQVWEALQEPDSPERKKLFALMVKSCEDKRHFKIERNQPRIDKMIAIATAWWERYVIPKIPPPIETAPNDRTFKNIIRTEETVSISPEAWSEMKIAKFKTKQAKAEEAKTVAIVKAEIGDAAAGLIPDSHGKLYYPKEEGNGYKADFKKLEEEYPEAFKECTKPQTRNVWREVKGE